MAAADDRRMSTRATGVVGIAICRAGFSDSFARWCLPDVADAAERWHVPLRVVHVQVGDNFAVKLGPPRNGGTVHSLPLIKLFSGRTNRLLQFGSRSMRMEDLSTSLDVTLS